MKQVLLILAVVMGQSVLAGDKKPLIADPIVEKAIRRRLKKPTGELTKADLIKVTFVVFEFTKLTDAGLKEVSKLQNLEKLSLPKQITDEGLKEVAQLQKLTYLHLTDTKITAAGLKEVAKLQQLEKLHLTFCDQISDAGLKKLAKLKKFKFLSLVNTQVTDAGVAELRKALPNCKIYRSPLPPLLPQQHLQQSR